MLIFRGMGEEYDPDAPLPLGYTTMPPPTKGGAIVDEKRRTMTFTEPEVITGKVPKKAGGFPAWTLWGGGAAVLAVVAYANKAKLRRIFG